MASPIRQLLALITQSVETLEAACKYSGMAIPSLDEPFTPLSEEFRANPEAAEAARIISAAALQLEAIVSPPQVSLYRIVNGYLKSSALRVCLEAGVTEILREAGPQGIHVQEMALKNGQDPQRMARFMRFLATHHIYREIAPDVFAHNRISSILDTGKSSAAILADPSQKHDGTNGFAALISHQLDLGFKAAAYSWEHLSDPTTMNSGEPDTSAFARAIGSQETLWTYLARPEERFRQQRFSIAMKGTQEMHRPESVVQAFNWSKFAPDSLIVDVGGGVGSACLALAPRFPQFRFVIQDREEVVAQGKELWKIKMPEAIYSGQVTFQVHNFFDPQPQHDATVFLVKNVLHDWSTDHCVKILSRLAAVANHDTTLILLEMVLPLATSERNSDNKMLEAPSPLLANYGATNDLGYNFDFLMFLEFNAQERTQKEFRELLGLSGWEFVAMHWQTGGDTSNIHYIEARKPV
ncbi:S-adenosyl-L-methionine-dependent methyltransferase [Favolaschia claudopus]|uniref:S-adenosyl-L-methionine-dependent methyltransferase n=1 Tax=Favolaschia claudopus TaxID=2862362 RepID=A0AAW0CSC2_9AGAR